MNALSGHDIECECRDCIPFDHTTRDNGHEIECFCDLCADDAHISSIGFTSCTCDQCDPEGEAELCMNIIRDQRMHEKIVANTKRTHGDNCACSFCDYLFHSPPIGDGTVKEVKDFPMPKCLDIVIASVETTWRVIEIRKESYGYSTSAISKFDGFTGETTFSLDLKEAEEELKRYKREDESRMIPPPEFQKKLDPIEYESEDEGDMPDIEDTVEDVRDTLLYRITRIHHGHHLYTVNVIRLSDSHEVESHFVDSPGTATLVVQDCVTKYQ